jgi:hypothetical protein
MRYSRLKESVSMLQQELGSSRPPKSTIKDQMSMEHRYSKRKSDAFAGLATSPLRMTYEEFMRNFLPQSPEIVVPVVGSKDV